MKPKAPREPQGKEGKNKVCGCGEALCFRLTHGPLRFMTFSTCRSLAGRLRGRVAERLNAAVLKTVDVVRRPGVQIPPLPPSSKPNFPERPVTY